MGEPKLRFKADDGSDFPKWEEKMFWDVFANLTNNTLSRECLNAESGQARNIHYGDVLVKYGAVVDVQRDGAPFVNPDVECKRWDCLKDGDVVIADTAEDETVGKAVEISNAGSDIVYSGLHTIACRPKEEFAPGYLGNYINSMSYHDQLRPYMQGIKVTSVSKTNIGLTHLLVPTLPEQRKIADFLSAVDAVIAAQQAEVDAWEQRKKGVMQKLFSQEVRFKADDGSDFPDWEEKTLGELCSPLTYGMNAAATKFDGENRYIRITDIDDETHALLPNDIVSPSGELDDKYLVKKGDILLARTGASTGKSYLYHQKDGKLFYAGFLIKAHVLPSSDDYFIYSQTLTDRYWKWVKTASMRSGQPRINANEYASYSFAVPSLPEQRKIADCLASMDEVIQKSKDELAKWRELKKGLLQQMFV
jgi:type I restriction enzyme S subunit